MPLAVVIDEGGFQARFDAGDDRFVNIAFFLFPGGRFNVEVNQFLTIDNGDTEFLGLCRIEQHAFHSCAPVRDACTKGAPVAGGNESVEWRMLHIC